MTREAVASVYDPNGLTGAEARYDYVSLPRQFEEAELVRFHRTTQKHHNANVARWTNAANHEWTLRHFCAVKLVLGATLSITSLRHAMATNLRVVEPYLSYYSLFSCSRALVLTDPTQSWRDGALFTISHDKCLKAVAGALGRLRYDLGDEYAEQARFMKDWRERFSYAFPALGLNVGGGRFAFDPDGLTEMCRTLVELAQMNSQTLQRAIEDARPNRVLDKEKLKTAARYRFGKYQVLDTDDAYRLDKIHRKRPYPVALDIMAELGMVEDFMGSWCAQEESDAPPGLYNPDEDWNALFSFG